MIKKLHITVIILMLLISKSCITPSSEFEKILHTQIEGCNNCEISLKETFDFQWDGLYVFKYTATPSEVKQIVGQSKYSYTEFKRKVVFMNNGQVVFYEELPTDISRVLDNQLVFDIPDSKSYKFYQFDEANFNVTKEKIDKGQFYWLEQMK